MSVTPITDRTVDLYGKTVTDLQLNVVIYGNAVSGILRYVDAYGAFDNEDGNYLALDAIVPDLEDYTIDVYKWDTTMAHAIRDGVIFDSDGGVVLCKVTDKMTQTLKVVASKDGLRDYVVTLTLSNLTLREDASEDETPIVGLGVVGLAII